MSDADLVGPDGGIDLAIGGEQPADGGSWVPLVEDDYLVMVRLYHRAPEEDTPSFRIERVDGTPSAELSTAARAATAEAFFR